jgi:hypothetical protein
MELVCAPAIIGEGASRPPRSFAAPPLCRLRASRQLGKDVTVKQPVLIRRPDVVRSWR